MTHTIHVPIPEAIANSQLLQTGGFAIFEGFTGRARDRHLLAEAKQKLREVQRNDVPVSDREELRGGSPARRFLSARGGSVQDAFYNASTTRQLLRQVTGLTFRPTGQQGTFTYYTRGGDFLDLHRDIYTCDLAVITCLCSLGSGGGELCLYPGRLTEPLSAIRAHPNQGAAMVSLTPGQTIVMFGGIVPHRVLPMARDQFRVVSVLCYRLI